MDNVLICRSSMRSDTFRLYTANFGTSYCQSLHMASQDTRPLATTTYHVLNHYIFTTIDHPLFSSQVLGPFFKYHAALPCLRDQWQISA
jgi:hypothetical protein